MAWRPATRRSRGLDRFQFLQGLGLVIAAAIMLRLFSLQVMQHGLYTALAQDQQQLSQQLMPKRGTIFVLDPTAATGLYPLSANRTLHLLYAIPKQVTDPAATTKILSQYVTTPIEDILKRLSKANDLYEPIQHYLTDEQKAKIESLQLAGLYFADEDTRYYPEKNFGSHLLGFVGFNEDKKMGRYGLERTYEEQLAGRQGYINARKDASGQLIATSAQIWQPAVNGADLILTIDRTIQYEACHQLNEAVLKHGADGGSIVIMNPQTGAVLAMCGAPDYDPNTFNTITEVQRFLNPTTEFTYEPGSVFKSFTMSAALNEGQVTPDTTYTDTGEIKIGSYTIKNSDGKANGLQTMTQVLEKSLNTGAIFAMNQIGPAKFGEYVRAFGFGQPTNVEVHEVSGNVQSLASNKDIYASTAAFGQGITVTPLQLATAYAALANGGKLMQPYVVDRIRQPDGTEVVTQPRMIRQVISPKTSATIGGMMVRVVQNGHGQRAGVPGYFVAGKTGTAQVPDPESGGYLKDVTIGTFAGFAPVDDPQFVMVVKIDHPRDVQFAESSAAPLFGAIAKFILLNKAVPPAQATLP
jgi:cell division protein FtsI/penicillin-binding protein 2